MSDLRPHRYRYAIALSLLVVAGCGQSELKKDATYSTEGKVLLHGQPASFVMIRLVPKAGGKGAEASGVTREDGTFVLRTYSNDDPDGAIPGEYTVILEGFDPVQAVGATLPPGAKPTKIDGEMDTKISVEIKAEPNNLDIEVP